jgi:adenosylcobinamide-GDP ribazoletransferase
VRSILAAIGLLTRIPVGEALWDEEEMSRSLAWMPLVGALVGLLVAATYGLVGLILPGMVAASVAIAIGILATGALHEDGLADTADAFGGGRDPDDVLRIMKDPAHGSFGVIALILSVVVRITSLAGLGTTTALLSLPVIHAWSRAGATGLSGFLPPARADGLGAAHAPGASRRWLVLGWLSAFLLGALLLGPVVASFAAVAVAGSFLVGWLARRRIGGQTGDVLGAAEQTVEALLYILSAGLVQVGWLQGAWWMA